MLELQKFIKEYPDDFHLLLKEDPYNLKITIDEHFMIFKYSQISSDFSIPLVREARGIILDQKDWSVAGRGFFKFFNFGEELADEINWKSAQVYDKVDGSIIRIWYNKYTASWNTSTNGTIDARNAPLEENPYHIENYYDLVMYTLDKMKLGLGNITSMVPKDFSIVCEISSPVNKIVVPYPDFKLTHLATINNQTGEEIELMIGLPKPLIYPLTTLEECITAVKALNPDNKIEHEGFVIKDQYNKRLKLKNDWYMHLHHLKGEGALTYKKALGILLENEQEELLAYYPEFQPIFDNVEKKFKDWKLQLNYESFFALQSLMQLSRKDYANTVKEGIDSAYMFRIYSNHRYTIDEYIASLNLTQLAKRIF